MKFTCLTNTQMDENHHIITSLHHHIITSILVLTILFSSGMNASAQAGIVNVVLGKTATASDTNNPTSQNGNKAVDGNVTSGDSRWVTTDGNGAHWLEIDLGGTYEISSTRLYYDLSNANEKQIKFRLEAFVNDEWVPVFEENNAPASGYLTGNIYSRTFTEVFTDKVRYYIPAWTPATDGGNSNYTNNRVRLYEIEIYSLVDNVVFQKPVRHSSMLSPYPGTKAVDGDKTNTTSRWVTEKVTEGVPEAQWEEHWIVVDLQGFYTINSALVVRDITSNATEKNGKFDLQAWTGSEWETLFSVREENSAVTTKNVMKEFDEITTDSVRLYFPRAINNRVRLFELEVYGRLPNVNRELYWTSSTHTGWNTSGNWSIKRSDALIASFYTPGSNDIIYIPGDAEVFPKLTGNKADNVCSEIHLGAGAEIGKQHLLTYNKAFIQYDFSSTGLARDQWHTLSNPLQQVYSGDFTFGGFPNTQVSKFVADDTYGKWVAVSGDNFELTGGDGFAYRVEDGTNTEKGLGLAGGIIDLPYFEREDADIALIHPNHQYNPNSHVSTFTGGGTATRSADAYKIVDIAAEGIFKKTVNFGTSPFALVGNPFLTTINFDAFQRDDRVSGVITGTYFVWTKGGNAAGFAGYNKEGGFGIVNEELTDAELNKFIAPQQSFVVVKAAGATETELTFDINAISSTGAESSLLKIKSDNDKLDIIAHNATADVLTYVANREGGQSSLSDKDSRKLLAELSNVPEIYTLKASGNSQVAVGANIIGNHDLSIPLVIATTYSGKLTLTFKGIDKYRADITLIDRTDGNKEYPLTGVSFEKEFDFVPDKNDNNEVIPTENRFVLQFANSTGLNKISTEQISVYNNDKGIQVISASGLIKQIAVYNAQGQMLYANNQVNAPAYTLSSLTNASGVCIVKVITEKGSKNIKIIKK